jgi:3-hydroxybutyryl-CoA dehydrogenase
MMAFQTCAVIGAGTMGRGIAQINAMAKIATTLIDADTKALESAKASIHQNLERGLAKGKVSGILAEQTISLIGFQSDFRSLEHVQLIIDAVPENLELKQEIFSTIDKLVSSDAVLATNTSSLSISAIAETTLEPDRVVGLHFFNPPHIMKLLEIVRGKRTTDKVIERCQAYATQIGKTCILVNDSPGFATSRLGICLANEAIRMLETKVANTQDIDTAMVLGYGHAMGPLQLTDLVGLDVRLAIGEYLHSELGLEHFKAPQLLKQKVAAGHLGKKSGKGFYSWDGDKCLGPADS